MGSHDNLKDMRPIHVRVRDAVVYKHSANGMVQSMQIKHTKAKVWNRNKKK